MKEEAKMREAHKNMLHLPCQSVSVRCTKYFVDFYLPEDKIAFEADGEYWHRNRGEYDAKRDLWIFDNFGVVVIRFSEKELKSIA